jgi:hypothetical protein
LGEVVSAGGLTGGVVGIEPVAVGGVAGAAASAGGVAAVEPSAGAMVVVSVVGAVAAAFAAAVSAAVGSWALSPQAERLRASAALAATTLKVGRFMSGSLYGSAQPQPVHALVSST